MVCPNNVIKGRKVYFLNFDEVQFSAFLGGGAKYGPERGAVNRAVCGLKAH